MLSADVLFFPGFIGRVSSSAFKGACGRPICRLVRNTILLAPIGVIILPLSMHRGPMSSVILTEIIFSLSFFLVVLLTKWVT